MLNANKVLIALTGMLIIVCITALMPNVAVAAIDRTRPVITSFTLPSTSSSLQVTGIRFVATDNVGVTGYYLSTSSITPRVSSSGWSSTAPTSYNFTSAGTKTLYAWAKDTAGNISYRSSASTTITLAADTQAPTVSITAPANNATVRGTITISATAADNIGVTRVLFYVNGILDYTDTSAPFSYSADTATKANGSYTLTARAYDAAGNNSLSSPVTIIVNNTLTTTYEINLAETGTRTVHSPWDTWALWVPVPVTSADADPAIIKFVAMFNATGGMLDFPENELYDEDSSGNPVYHFERLTTKLDTVLAAGFKPYIVLSYSPVLLASDPTAISGDFGTNTSPPKDWNKYYNFIKALFLNLKTLYGAEEVSTWRYRCGTEPDYSGWWTGSTQDWFKFYDYTVSAARAANPDVGTRISINPGNFMSTSSSLIPALAARIQAGTFSIPGESPVVPTALSFSYYDDNPVKISSAVANIRAALAPYSKFAGIPLSIDEGYVLDDENGAVMYSRLDGTELGGSYFALLTDTVVEQDLHWSSLWNTGKADVPPPLRNVLNLFQQHLAGGVSLTGTKVAGQQTLASDVVGGLAVRPVGGVIGQARLMLFNHNGTRSASASEPLLLRLTGVPAAGVKATWYRIDRNHGNYSTRWLADSLGVWRNGLSPYDLDPFNTDDTVVDLINIFNTNRTTYAALAQVNPEVESVLRIPAADGTLEIAVTLPPHGVVFLTLDLAESINTNTLSGSISPAPAGGGALVTLTEGATRVATVTAAADGSYSFTNLANGSYTVTPSKSGITFSPASAAVVMNGTNIAGINFSATGLVVDVTTFMDSSSFAPSITTPVFSTRAGDELLLAFVAAATTGTTANTTVTGVTGGGLNWTLVRRTNAQFGTAEIWRAFATTPLSHTTVTAALSQNIPASITLVAFADVNIATPVGAVGGGSSATGAPTASLITQSADSWVFGVGTDWDHAVARSLGPNQVMVHQNLDPNDYTTWVQRQNATIQPAGTVVTINNIAPVSDRWNLSIVEIMKK